MWKTIVRRFLILIPQLFVLSIIIFLLAQAMPGDALTGLVDPNMQAEDIAHLRYIHGLDRPWYERYVDWIGNLLRGDLGMSWRYRAPVVDIIAVRVPNTFRLALVTIIFTFLIAVPAGIIAAKNQDKLIDRGIIFYTFFSMSMPTVIFALINVFIFGFTLRWFPIQGSVAVEAVPGTFDYVLSRLHHVLLPAFTGALLSTTGIINLLRSEVIEAENSEYVITARSKGVPGRVVYGKHILKNASLPLVTSVAVFVPFLLMGSIFIEMIFSFPGMGRLFLTAILDRDFAVVNALIMIFSAITIIGILLADIVMMIVDPRIRIK